MTASMGWADDANVDFVGEGDALRIADSCRMAYMLGLWPEKTVRRERRSDGRAAWMRLDKSGLLVCVCIAPWDDVYAADCVAEVEFFLAKWPAAWITKRNAETARTPLRGSYATGWACGIIAGKKEVMLCKVGEHSGEELISVVTRIDGPAIPIADMPCKRWWPMDKHIGAMEVMWNKAGGAVRRHNYILLCMHLGTIKKRLAKSD